MPSPLAELQTLLPPDRLLTGPTAKRAYDCDAYTVDKSPPDAIAFPVNTAEVQQLVQWCLRHQITYTPRGAGTGLSGGALAAKGGLLISTKRLIQILEIDLPNRQLLAQSGIPNLAISQAVADHGLHFAPDPSSQSVSTLGGNIAENSGGPHTLKYGVSMNHILALTMVNTEGEIESVGSRVPGQPGPDFLSLVVGAEGTTGIVTEAWVKLVPLPTHVQTALIGFASVHTATRAVSEIIATGIIPAALEMMDHGILGALNAAFGLQFPEGAKALLLVECDGTEADIVHREMEQVRQITSDSLSFELATDETARKKLWTARKKGIGAMGRLAPTIVTHDGVIPRSKLPEMLDYCYEVAANANIGVANLFHAGDGNLHPCFYFDDREPGIIDKVIHAGELILKRCIELGGSVTGEHGVGVEKVSLMKQMFTPEDLQLQHLGKQVFNSGDLLNPCKVLPDQKSCVEHIQRWRGTAW